MNQPLLVPDLPALKRKFADPPPLLARCHARFRDRLAVDGEFRRHNIFLNALLGDPAAVAEAKGEIVMLALNPAILAHNRPAARTSSDTLDNHIWCVAPRAMRLAAYFTWLDLHGAWTPQERRMVGTGLMDFFDTYTVPVLRARAPGGHNQHLSMTLCSAVTGHAFAEVNGVAGRARALREWTLPKLRRTLGMMHACGYTGEGSTYQSDVVAALVMWAGVFLQQIGESDVWNRSWPPGGWRMADTFRVEAAMGGCGGLLPPWDDYGWQRIHNLAARTLWAGLSGNLALLQAAETVWDEQHNLAWRPDDRLWTLLYWPEERAPCPAPGTPHEDTPPSAVRQAADNRQPTDSPVLTGWSIPAVAAAIEHLPRRLRVMAVWDRCSGGVQAVGRAQVNPNHLIVDLDGEPITADGWQHGGERLFADAAMDRSLQAFSPVEQEMIARQYGSLEAWSLRSQQGFLGASCAIVIDGWDSYFPRWEREGRLVFERRAGGRHTFAAEAAAYYQPAFDVTRMRRTVSMNEGGVIWVADDLRAASAHDFTWRVWLRRGARATGPRRVRLDLRSGRGVTFAWLIEADGGTERGGSVACLSVPAFPASHGFNAPWPDQGSERCDLTAAGRAVRFVTCVLPEGSGALAVARIADGAWEATWEGGADRFELPPEIAELPDAAPVAGDQGLQAETTCDLDDTPYGLLDEPDAGLLAALDSPPAGEWRRTGAVMQTLAARGKREALPGMAALLLDARQNYTVHSVAAWCLGRARYAPAADVLRRMTHIPEVNTAARARWALERIEGPSLHGR